MGIVVFIIPPLLLGFLIWFYFARNPYPVPVTPGANLFLGHMHHFFTVTKEKFYLFEQIYFRLTDPVHGAITHMKFFAASNLSLNTVETAAVLLKSNANINKSFLYDDFACWIKGSVLVLPGRQWQIQRKMLTPVFHFNILEDFEKVMKNHALILLDKLNENVEAPLIETFQEVTFHSLAETSFGAEYKSIEESAPLLQSMSDVTKYIFFKSFNPLNRWSDWIYFNLDSDGKKCRKAMDEMYEHVMELVNARKRDMELEQTKLHNGHRSFLDHLVYEQAEHGQLTDEQIVAESTTILLAGHGTTTGTIGFAIYYLCKHQDVQEKLYQEISQQLEGKNSFEEIDINSCSYVNMVVKETLRLQPPVSIIGRKLSEPMEVAGVVIPAGTNIDVSIWWAHRDPKHWPDPETFDPERFTPENSRGRNPYAYIPFAAGPRNCVGQRFGSLESRIMVAAMVYGFRMTTEQEMGKELFRDVLDIAVVPGPNFKVKLVPRF